MPNPLPPPELIGQRIFFLVLKYPKTDFDNFFLPTIFGLKVPYSWPYFATNP